MSQIDLIDVFKLAFVCRMNSDFEILTSRDKHTLTGNDSSAFSGVGFQNKPKLAPLIPAMDATVGSTTIAKPLFVKCRAQEFGLGILLSECSIFEELSSCISWMPKLERSRGDCGESQIVRFL